MRPDRLSYETAGVAVQARGETPAAAHAPLTAAAHGPRAASACGRPPAQARQRRVVVATMLAGHALGVAGLLNAGRLRDEVVEAKPMFVAVVDAPAPVAPARPLPAPPAAKMPPPPQLTLPLVAPEPLPSPSPMVAQALLPPPASAPAAPVEAPAAPAPSPLPKTIPPSAVQYLVPLAPVYPRISVKMRESGMALVRVLIDEAGLPRTVQLVASSGFGRLDESALAAIRNARFKPYLENGVAVQAWAVIPLEFELPA